MAPFCQTFMAPPRSAQKRRPSGANASATGKFAERFPGGDPPGAAHCEGGDGDEVAAGEARCAGVGVGLTAVPPRLHPATDIATPIAPTNQRASTRSTWFLR